MGGFSFDLLDCRPHMNRIIASALAISLAFVLSSCTSALHSAALRGRADIVAGELSRGADVNERSGGLTALMAAATSGEPNTVKVLLDYGADPHLKTASGDTALQLTNTHLRRNPTAEEERAVVALLRAAMGLPPLPGSHRPAETVNVPAVALTQEKRGIVSDIDSPKGRGTERPDDFALVIGIEDYQSVPKADYAVRDAETVRRSLEAIGFPPRNIISLEGAQATASRLKSYLDEWLPLNVRPNSTLFVYYSGHGAPDAKTGDAYLVPWDGDPKFLKSTALPLKAFYASLAKTKAKRVIVALDACFSGGGGRSVLAQGARPLVSTVVDAVPTGGNLVVLAAASGDEITGTLAEQGHGLFTYHLLKGLAADPKASARQLFDYVKPRVQDDARRDNRGQTPVLLGAADLPLFP